MSDLPLVSVVTPSFNQAEYVEATLRSVLDQRYPALQYVVVDGGSTDGSAEIIRRYEDRLWSWTSEPDEGHANALNKGFLQTSGEIMSWINSSDLYYPWTLQTVAEVFGALPEVDWIVGIPTRFAGYGGPRSVLPDYYNAYDLFGGGTGRRLQQESVFWRRRLWERAGGGLNEELTCAADFELWLRFARIARLYHVETVLGGFRIHGERLGDADDGLYEREARDAIAHLLPINDRRFARRAAFARVLGSGRLHTAAVMLGKVGIPPWYRHPRIVFDFDRETWVIR